MENRDGKNSRRTEKEIIRESRSNISRAKVEIIKICEEIGYNICLNPEVIFSKWNIDRIFQSFSYFKETESKKIIDTAEIQTRMIGSLFGMNLGKKDGKSDKFKDEYYTDEKGRKRKVKILPDEAKIMTHQMRK